VLETLVERMAVDEVIPFARHHREDPHLSALEKTQTVISKRHPAGKPQRSLFMMGVAACVDG